MPAPRASFLVADHTAKAKEPFTTGEELILPAANDLCHELLAEAEVQKVVHIPLWANTITRQTDERAEDTEAQLLELMSHHGTQPRLMSLLMLTTRQRCLFLCDIFFRKMCMRMCYVHFCCQPTPHSCRTVQVFE